MQHLKAYEEGAVAAYSGKPFNVPYSNASSNDRDLWHAGYNDATKRMILDRLAIEWPSPTEKQLDRFAELFKSPGILK